MIGRGRSGCSGDEIFLRVTKLTDWVVLCQSVCADLCEEQEQCS